MDAHCGAERVHDRSASQLPDAIRHGATDLEEVKVPMLLSRYHALYLMSLAIVAPTSWLSTAGKLAAQELAIVEAGPNAEIGLEFRGLAPGSPIQFQQLKSPSGDVFVTHPVPGYVYPEFNRLRDFDSLVDAFEFVSGNWQVTVSRRFFPSTIVTGTFEFNVNEASSGAVNRTPPSLLTPYPGEKNKNGTTIPIEWDYVTTGVAPNRTKIILSPQFDPPASGGWVVSTPNPAQPYSSTSSLNTFSQTLASAPGATTNRFRLTMTENTPQVLPLDVEITLASYISLNQFVSIGESEGMAEITTPAMNFFYSRKNDPITVRLTVPEPTSFGISGLLACCGCLWRRRACA